MRYIIVDKKYSFVSFFDTDDGTYIRTGILDSEGKDTGIDPFMASYPHLIDVGIMGHCIHGKTGLCSKAGIECYQSGMLVEKPNMTVDNFKKIVHQSRGKCNQIALGGRGDPDQHENFEEFLKISRENQIVPNFTTSGYGLTLSSAKLCKEYCGAVAVSWYRSEYTIKAINILLDVGVKTNIHFVLGNNSIDEAIDRLKRNDFPKGINAVIFLLHKPVGQGTDKNVINVKDPRLLEFFSLIDIRHPFKIGVDSCTVPGIFNFSEKIRQESIDSCEAGRFSCYIDSDMNMMPCSFDQKQEFKISIKHLSIEKAWNSKPFDKFRNKMHSACPNCDKRNLCLGGCPIVPKIVLCENKL